MLSSLKSMINIRRVALEHSSPNTGQLKIYDGDTSLLLISNHKLIIVTLLISN